MSILPSPSFLSWFRYRVSAPATKDWLMHFAKKSFHGMIFGLLHLAAFFGVIALFIAIISPLFFYAIPIRDAFEAWKVAFGWKFITILLAWAILAGFLRVSMIYLLAWLWEKVGDFDRRVLKPRLIG